MHLLYWASFLILFSFMGSLHAESSTSQHCVLSAVTLGTLPDPQTLISSPVAGDNDKDRVAVVMTPELFFYDGALGGKCHLWLSFYDFKNYVTFFI